MEEPFDRPETVPPPPKMPIGKVMAYNFGILLLYMLLTGVGKGEAAIGSLMIDAVLIVVQAGLNLIAGVVLVLREQLALGRALLLAAFLVGIIGFGVCMGKYAAFG
jgi:hypothetical protein